MRLRRATLKALALSLVLTHAGAGRVASASAGPHADLVERVKRAVVVVNSFDEAGRLLSQGSGFFVREDEIITNLHVVGRAARVEVVTFGGQTCAVGGLIALDARRDLALLQLDVGAKEVATLSVETEPQRAGEEVFVVSNPRGSFWQVSKGTTLSLREFPDLGWLVPVTAHVSRGSSGGPVVNLRGNVVGVATMSLKTSVEEYFALPGEHVAHLRPGPALSFPLHLSE